MVRARAGPCPPTLRRTSAEQRRRRAVGVAGQIAGEGDLEPAGRVGICAIDESSYITVIFPCN
jgi:hypothetical protein